MSKLFGRFDTMALDAAHLAFLNLLLDSGPRVSLTNSITDSKFLFPADMIEFKHNGIIFAAIYTGMSFEVHENISYQFFRSLLPLLLNVGSMGLFMSFIPFMLNPFCALSAMNLQTIFPTSIFAESGFIFETLAGRALLHCWEPFLEKKRLQ